MPELDLDKRSRIFFWGSTFATLVDDVHIVGRTGDIGMAALPISNVRTFLEEVGKYYHWLVEGGRYRCITKDAKSLYYLFSDAFGIPKISGEEFTRVKGELERSLNQIGDSEEARTFVSDKFRRLSELAAGDLTRTEVFEKTLYF